MIVQHANRSFDAGIDEGYSKAKTSFGYTEPIIDKCCAHCAFFMNDNYGGNHDYCALMKAFLQLHRDGIVGSILLQHGVSVCKTGCCKRFLSMENAKLLSAASSPEELAMKKEIYGIEIDDDFLVMLQDGFMQSEQATEKMKHYMGAIIGSLPRHGIDLEVPIAVNIREVSKDGKLHLSSNAFFRSSNFSRVNQFLKTYAKAYQQLYRESMSKLRDLFVDTANLDTANAFLDEFEKQAKSKYFLDEASIHLNSSTKLDKYSQNVSSSSLDGFTVTK